MCSSLDGLHSRQIASTAAILAQGMSSHPGQNAFETVCPAEASALVPTPATDRRNRVRFRPARWPCRPRPTPVRASRRHRTAAVAGTGLLLALGRPLDAAPLGLLELAQIGDHPLPRAAIGPIRLDQRPVGVSVAVFRSITRANEHARILGLKQL